MDSPAHMYREAVACYTGQGLDRLHRNWKYLRLPDNRLAFYGTLATVTTIGVGGAVLGGMCARSFALGSPGQVIAAGGGFTIGLGVGIYGQMYIVEKSKGFNEWKGFQITAALKDLLRRRFVQDPIWQRMTCAISKTPMLIPVRAPSGVLYDYETVIQYLDPVTKSIKDPLGTPPFHEDDLITDRERSFIILKRVKHLMEQDIALCEKDTDLFYLLLDEQTLLEEAIKAQYESARSVIEHRRSKEIITEDEYEIEIAEFKDLFGRGPKRDLDWTHNWKQILDERWEKLASSSIKTEV